MLKNYFTLNTFLAVLFCFSSFISSAQFTVTLGSGTAIPGTTTAGPINQFYRSLHCQIVYTASELNAVGISGGNMTKLGFFIASGVTNPLPNYTVKLKHTTATNVATYDGIGLTTVYNTASYNPPAGGFDLLTLTAPFTWNGVDNILVDVCFDQVTAFTSTGVVRIYSPAVVNGFISARSDLSSQCGIACSTISTNKPQIQFEFSPTAPLDLGVSAFLKPLGSKICFANDTIVARVKNFGSAAADFSVTPTVLTVITSGPNANTYTLALNSGTLATNATQDFTISTNYNLANIGTYKLKGFTTVAGDGSALNDTTRLSITKSPVFTKSILPDDSVCLGIPVQLNANYNSTKQVGTGTIVNTSTSYPAPFGNYWEGAKHQFLFLASELTAAGLTAGNINSLSFNATNLNATDPLTNYNVAIATTTVTNITTFQTSGFTTYFSATSYTPVLGSNTHPFSTPFIWDGTSNIIIETCFNNEVTGFTNLSNNVSITQSSTSFTSSIWFRADNNLLVCSTSTTSTGTMSQRPNISFSQPTTVTYSWSPATELSASNIANPLANLSSTRTYTVEGTIAGCMTYDTVRIFIKPTPTPNLGNDSLYCNLPVILTANTTASNYLWNNGSISSGLNVTASGKYWIRATNSNGCTNSDTVMVTLGSMPIVTLGPDTTFCAGNSINLYAGSGSGNTFIWSTNATSPSISVSTSGTYSVIVTHTTGCQASDIVNVTSKAKPTVSLVFSGIKSFCTSDNLNRLLSEGTPANGTYIGAGVTASASANYFNPSLASQGSHIIIYNFTAPNGCSNLAKDTLVVNACVGIEELYSSISLNVIPNPSSGVFVLEINSDVFIDGKITITSIDGKLVYEDLISGNVSMNKSIDITTLADGIYYLKLETNDSVKTFKVLKQ